MGTFLKKTLFSLSLQFLIQPQFYLLFLIIFLPAQLGYHFWPSYSRIFGLRIDYLSPTIYLTDLIFLGLLISYTSQLSWQRTIKPRLMQWMTKPSRTIITIGLLLVICNLLFSSHWPTSLYQWLRIGQLVFLGWYVSRHQSLALKLLRQVLPYQIIFLSFLAITQFFLQSSLGGPLWWLGERTFTLTTPGIAKTNLCQIIPVISQWLNAPCQMRLRPYATFSHPNSLAGYLLICLILISPLIFKKNNKAPSSIVKSGALILGSFALLLTFSRTVWLAAVVVLIISLFMHSSRIKSKFLLKTIYFLVFISLVSPFLSFLIFQPFSLDLTQTISVRLQLLHLSWQMIQDHWLFGVGLGNFIPAASHYISTPRPELLQPVHNIFWLITSETGLLGLTLVLWFLIIKLLPSKSSLIPNIKYLILAIILITATTDHYWLTLQQNRLLLSLITGLLI